MNNNYKKLLDDRVKSTSFNYKKLLDTREKSIPKKIFDTNNCDEYTIITPHKNENIINSQKDLLIKLEDQSLNIDKYNIIVNDRKNEEDARLNDYHKFKNILDEQKKKTLYLLNKLNVK